MALALSGGGDSLALLRLAARWCAAARRPLLALTVDHGLHPASAGWTAFAGDRARGSGAAWRSLTWTDAPPAHGLAAAARAARHGLLAQAAREAGSRVILFGHTRDDVLEGERMRADGSPTLGRLRAWGPSPAWPEGRGLALLRPLLGVGRAELRDWLAAEGEAWWVEDPANDDPASPRARVRHTTLPGADVPAPADAPPALADLARRAAAGPEGSLGWSAERLAAASPADVARALATAAVCVGGGALPPRSGRAAAFAHAALAGEASRTLAGARVQVGNGEVVLTRAAPRVATGAQALQAPSVWDGRFEVVADTDGWRVAALAGHAARLPPADRTALAALPAAARPMLPVLLDAEGRPRLPRPLGGGPGHALSLAGPRLRLALGAIATERELTAA